MNGDGRVWESKNIPDQLFGIGAPLPEGDKHCAWGAEGLCVVGDTVLKLFKTETAFNKALKAYKALSSVQDEIKASGLDVPYYIESGHLTTPCLIDGKNLNSWITMGRVQGSPLTRLPFTKIDWSNRQQRDDLKRRAEEVIDVAAALHVDAGEVGLESFKSYNEISLGPLSFTFDGMPQGISRQEADLVALLRKDITACINNDPIALTFVHGDFHPGNILLSGNGRYGCIDFDDTPGLSTAAIDLQRICALDPDNAENLIARYNGIAKQEISPTLVLAMGMGKTIVHYLGMIKGQDAASADQASVIFTRLSKLGQILGERTSNQRYTEAGSVVAEAAEKRLSLAKQSGLSATPQNTQAFKV